MPRIASLLALITVLTACSDPAPMIDGGAELDAPIVEDAGPPPVIAWTESAPLPAELAYGAAILLTDESTRWIFVVGGATTAADAIGTISNRVYRAEVNLDGSLGTWMDVGGVAREASPIPVSQHGILRLTGEDLRQGFAVAGGHTGTQDVTVVLASYVDSDGSLDTPWGAFSPRITVGEGQWQSAFMPFDPHALALVGGLTTTGFTARVQFAEIYLGVEVPMFTEGPALPAPRADHSWVRRDRSGMNPDLYIIGGHNDDGATLDILRTTRDGEDKVDGWETVGTLPDAPHGHASVIVDDQLYILGGVEGTSITDRVRRADVASDGSIGTFEDVADARLSMPLANAAMVQDDVIVYLIGGRTGADGASSTHVLIGRF